MEFHNEYINCSVEFLDCKIRIFGNILEPGKIKSAVIIAPNTFDKKASYSGTGLPFPCEEIAFENTPNQHIIDNKGNFDVIFTYPNSYYTVANKKKIVSSIFFIMETNDGQKYYQRFELKDMYVLRTLVNRETRNGPEFYSKKYDLLPIDTSEILMYKYSELKQNYGLA